MEKKVNKSEIIRTLWDQGMTVMQISQHMGIRYQYAYNVVSWYVKQKALEVEKYAAPGDSRLDPDTTEDNT